jgi:asparagine synthase (glutamine-hydrolysing)
MIHGKINLTQKVGNIPPTFFLASSIYLERFDAQTTAGYFCVIAEKINGKNLQAQIRLCSDLSDFAHKLDQWPRQALLLHWPATTAGTLIIRRNASGQCPLYVTRSSENLWFDWDPCGLYPYLDQDNLICLEHCAAFLDCNWSYGPKTLFKDIVMLPERCTMRANINQTDMEIFAPDNIAPIDPLPLKNNADVVEAFLNLLQSETNQWPEIPGHTACELSSGLDTCLTAHLLKQKTGGRFLTAGYLPIGNDRAMIAARRDLSVKALGVDDICVPIEKLFSLAFDPSSPTPYWPYQAPTGFEKQASAKTLKVRGIDIIFSGIGGDELCMLTDHERKSLAAGPKHASSWRDSERISLLHPRLQKFANADPKRWPDGLVPHSAHDVANSIAPIYLRYGLWYAHPLASPTLQTFAHALPLEWRLDRRLSRECLRRLGMDEEFLRQTPKESLAPSLDHLLTDDRLFDSLFKQARAILKSAPQNHPVGTSILLCYALELGLRSVLSAQK